MKLSTEETLVKIKQGDETVLKDLYLHTKPKFMGYISKEFNIPTEACLDLYQDSFSLLYTKITSGQIAQVTSSFDTLLIGFGRNLARNTLRKRQEEYPGELPDQMLDHTPLTRLEEKAKKHRVEGILKLMGPDCKKVLTAFYFFQKSMKEIALEMGYSGSAMAKKKKYQCLKAIRTKLDSKSWN